MVPANQTEPINPSYSGQAGNGSKKRQKWFFTLNIIAGVITIGLSMGNFATWSYLCSLINVLLVILAVWDNALTQTESAHAKLTDLSSTVSTLTSAVAALDTTIKNTKQYVDEEYKTILGQLLELGRLEHKALSLALRAKKGSLLESYLQWVRPRYNHLLESALDGVIIAPNADYFGFAKRFLLQAKTCVHSTSVVDPNWYDLPDCGGYIGDQVEHIINKGKSYTRYFIVNPEKDTPARRAKTVEVIRRQVALGFKVVVVHTSDYSLEHDAAKIDNDKLWMRAEVPTGHEKLPDAKITGCLCYIDFGGEYESRIRDLKGYFNSLENSRACRRFCNETMSEITETSVYTKLC